MNEKKKTEDLRLLHGYEYVQRFEEKQSPMRLDRLMSRIPLSSNMHVADFGCGNGLMLPHVAPRVATYTGVDFSPEFIESARVRVKNYGFTNAGFHCADINDFCAKRANAFDVGFAMDFSEHVPDKQWVQILASIRSSLKPGGALYLHTPNALFFIEIMKERGFILKQFPEHVAVRNAADNTALLRQAGFETVEVTTLPHYNVLRYLHPLSYLPLLGRYFEARLFIKALA